MSRNDNIPQSSQDSLETLPETVAPRLHAGERVCSTWEHIRLSVAGADVLRLGTNATSPGLIHAGMFGHGRLYITTTRLVFELTPTPNPSVFADIPTSAAVTPVTIPLAWLSADSLIVRRPFFDGPHVTASFDPCFESFPCVSDMSPCHDPSLHRHVAQLRLYPLDFDAVPRLHTALSTILADRATLLRHSRTLREALRHALHDRLVPTHEHYAFVDPHNPHLLHLATQMAYPTN